MPDNGASVTQLPRLRLVGVCETERVLDLLTDDLLARRNLNKLNENEAASGPDPEAA